VHLPFRYILRLILTYSVLKTPWVAHTSTALGRKNYIVE